MFLPSIEPNTSFFRRFFKLISHEYISIRSKNLSGTLEFLCEGIQQQKPLNTWLEIFQSTSDSIKLTDILINLTLPMDIMSKFDQVILKNSESTIQLVAMKFLSMVLERVKEALNIIMNVPLACDKISTLEAYQQAILRVSWIKTLVGKSVVKTQWKRLETSVYVREFASKLFYFIRCNSLRSP